MNRTDQESFSVDLFRREALDHYLRETEGRGVLRVSPPWTWILMWSLGALVISALLFSIFGRTEINERGSGILRPASGVRLLTAQSAGIVAEILAPTGTMVQAGQPILRIESPSIQGAALEAQTGLAVRLQDYKPVLQSLDELHAQQRMAHQQRLTQAREEVDRCRATLQRSRDLLEAMKRFRDSGIYSVQDFNREEENKLNAERQLANAEGALRQTQLERFDLENQHRTQAWRDRADLASAKARAQAVGLTERQTLVVAPEAGLVDGLILRVGDPVQGGNLLAKLVPKNAPLMVVAFLQEKDRAFVQEGDSVKLELNQFPYAEFGAIGGRIRRVAEDLASPSELEEAFGRSASANPQPPSFRVEIELPSEAVRPGSRVRLRPGMLLNVRFTLRSQSLITFAIEPLRKWLN